MKKVLVFSLVLLLAVGLFFGASSHDNSDKETFDKCANAKYFNFNYNPEFYDEGSAELYSEQKIKILKECGYIGTNI